MSTAAVEPTLPKSALDKLVARAQRLYTLPRVALQVLELTRDEGVDAQQLQRCVESDPALAAKVLRAVNNPLFGAGGKIASLRQALALLGTKPLRLLVLGFSLPRRLFTGLEAPVYREYWRHALIKSAAAREICRRWFALDEEELLAAALMQDLGMLVLLQQLDGPYMRFLNAVRSRGLDLARLETTTLGFDHTTLSARLLESWRLPDRLVAIVAAPLDPQRIDGLPEETRDPARVLWLAEQWALVGDHSPEQRERRLADELAPHIEQPGPLEELEAAIDRRATDLADALQLSLPDGWTGDRLVREAHARLSDEVEEIVRSSEVSAEIKTLKETVELQATVEAMAQRNAEPPVDSPEDDRPLPPGDPLSDPGVLGTIEAAVDRTRASRGTLSLLVLGIDRLAEVTAVIGPPKVRQLVRRLRDLCAVRLPEAACVDLEDGRLALVAEGMERGDAARAADELIEQAAHGVDNGSRVVSFSAGVAAVDVPAKNFAAEELIATALRCLTAAQEGPGRGVKSLEIF